MYYYNTNLLPHPMPKKGDSQQDYLYFCLHDYQDNYLDNIIESMAFPNLAKTNHNWNSYLNKYLKFYARCETRL